MRILLIILLFTVPVFAGDGIGGHIEIGKDIYSDVTYTDLRIDYQFTFWNVHLIPYGDQITWFEYNKNSGNPFCGVYTIGTELKYYNITFDLQHFCSHTIRSTREVNRRYYDSPIDCQMTKFSIRYSF